MRHVPNANGWNTIPLRYVCKLNPPITFDDLDEDDEVTFLPMEKVKAGYFIPHTGKVSSNAASYNAFSEGDVLLAKVTPCFENGNIAIAENLNGGRGFGSSELYVLRPIHVVGRFLFYSLQSPLFKQEGEASMTGAGGLKRVSPDVLRQYRIHLPSESTQQTIADYLDRETARVDALMAAKERLLGLLAEKRQALSTHAVTRGLDPHAPLRDSGIPWLGPIPAHWRIERAKWMFRERDQRSQTGEDEMLTVSHLTGVTPRSEKDVNMFEAETTEGYKLCQQGDLVINTLWAWMGAMGVAPIAGIVSPAYNVYTPGPDLEPDYVDAMVRLPIFAQEVTRYSKGVWSSRLRLYPEGFFETVLPVPPSAEQKDIVAFIRLEITKIKNLGSTTERTIELLRERRSALIAAAVTGQIQVA